MKRLITDFFKPISTDSRALVTGENEQKRKSVNHNTDAPTLKKKIRLPYPLIMSDDDEDISYQSESKRMSEDTERRKNIQMNNSQGESSNHRVSVNSNDKIKIYSNVVIPDKAVEKEGGSSKINKNVTSCSSVFVADNEKLTTENGFFITMEKIENAFFINMEKTENPFFLNKEHAEIKKTVEEFFLKLKMEGNKGTSLASYSKPNCKDNFPKNMNTNIVTSPSTSKAVIINSSESSSKFEDKKEKQSHKEMEFLKKTFEDTLQDTAKKNLLTSAEITLIETFFKMTEKIQYFLLKLFTLHMWHNIRDFCTEIKLDFEEILKDHKYDEFVEQDITNLNAYEMLTILDSRKLYRLQTDLRPDLKYKKKSKIIPSLMEKCEEGELKQAAKKYLGICIKMKDNVWSTFYKAFMLQCYCNPSYFMDIQNYLKDMTDKVRHPEMSCYNYIPFKKKARFLRFFEAVLMNIKLNRELENMNRGKEPKKIVIVKNICDEAYQKLKNCDADGRWRKSDDFLQQFSAEYIYIDILQSNIQTLLTKYQETVIDWLEYLTKNYPHYRHIGIWYKNLAEIKMNYLKKYTDAGEHLLIVYRKCTEKYNVFDSLQLIELNQMCKKIITTKTYKLWPSLSDQLAEYMAELSIGGSRNVTVKYIDVDANESLTSKRKRTDNHDIESETLEQYKKEGYEGVYCQEKYFAAVFVLFFWDVIYEYHVPNAVLSKLQTAPLDIYSNDFYKCRYEEVEHRLEDIATGWSRERLEDVFRQNCRNHSHEKTFVDFDILKTNYEEIEKVVRYIDRKVLSEILKVFARNSGKCRNGIPKLFLWNAESQYKFVAVENRMKKFDHNEHLWLEFLRRVGANVEVCRRSDMNPEVKSTKKFKNDCEEDH